MRGNVFAMCSLRKRSALVCNIADYNRFIDCTFGLSMIGWASHSPLLCQRFMAPPWAMSPSPNKIAAGDAIVLQKARPSRNSQQDDMSWGVTETECTSGAISGPNDSLNELRGRDPRLLNFCYT